MDVDLRTMLWERGLDSGRPSQGHFLKLHSSQMPTQSPDIIHNDHYVKFKQILRKTDDNKDSFNLREIEALTKIFKNLL